MRIDLEPRTLLGAGVVALCLAMGCGWGPRPSEEDLDGGGSTTEEGPSDGDGDGAASEPEREPWHPPEDASFGARVSPPKVDRATRKVGEACSTYGASDCLGGTCLKVAPLPNPLQVCTQTCDTSHDCPGGWTCTAVRPGVKALCTPSLEIARRLRTQATGGAR